MISLIVAMTERQVIGLNNRLPWHLSEDLKRFKRLTMGKSILMGRKTLESIGKALPGRRNLVLTRDSRQISIPGVEIFSDWPEALAAMQQEPETFVIGGREIYALAWPHIRRLYLTLIHKDFPGDTYFPTFDLEREFEILEREPHAHPIDPEFTYTFIVAQRKT